MPALVVAEMAEEEDLPPTDGYEILDDRVLRRHKGGDSQDRPLTLTLSPKGRGNLSLSG